MNKEMQKLRDALDAAGVKWYDNSEVCAGINFERTKFNNKFGVPCSVIYIKGMSIGWQGDFLESMPPVHYEEIYDDDFWKDDVEGFLTAEEIITEWV